MSQKRNQKQKGKKQNSEKNINELNLSQVNNSSHIGKEKKEQEESKSASTSSIQIDESQSAQSIKAYDKQKLEQIFDQLQYGRQQKIQQQNPSIQAEQNENLKEGLSLEFVQANQSIISQLQMKQQLQNNTAIPQLIVGSTPTVERKGILKNAQQIYKTEPLQAPLPVSTALYKCQKDIRQIDKLQHLKQQSFHNHNNSHKHNHHHIQQQNNLNDHQTIGKNEDDSIQEQNNFSINMQGNSDDAYPINRNVQNVMNQKQLNAAQPSLNKSSQEIQLCMDQYIQSKRAKKQAEMLDRNNLMEEINFQQQNGRNLKQQKQISSNRNRTEEFYNENQDEYEDEEEEEEEDEDDEIYEELDEDDDGEDEDEDEEDEEIEEEIDEEDDIDNELQSSQQINTKFLHSDKMDIDGLRKKRIAMNQDKQNNTIILNIKAQKKCVEIENSYLPSQQIPNNQNQCLIKYNNFNNSGECTTVTPPSNYSSSSSSTTSNSKEGTLASQILKEKQNKKQMQQELVMQQHSLQFQKQIESINNMYADAQEFKRQIQLKQNLLKMQQQMQSPSNHIQNTQLHTTSPNSLHNFHDNTLLRQTNSQIQYTQETETDLKQLIQKKKILEQNYAKAQPQPPESSHQNRNHTKIQFSTEIKNIFDQLDLLDYSEKKKATMVREQEFNMEMQNMIDCVGCKESLHQFLNELFQQAHNSSRQSNYDGIHITKSREICILDNFLENNFNIASFLQFHQNKQSMLENLNRNFNLFKKSIGSRSYRCNLHSKKPIPCLWKDNFEQLFDPESCSKQEVIEIEEKLFLSNLDKYLKKRKFCGTCKENIMGEYQKLKENVEMNQDEEQYMNGEYDQMVQDEDENHIHINAQYYEQQQLGHHSGQQFHTHHHHGDESCHSEGDIHHNQIIQEHIHDQDNRCIAHAEEHVEEGNLAEDDDQEYEDEIDEDEEEEDDDEDEVDLDDEQYDLINCIKYCNKTNKISIPMQVGFIQEIMSKAQIDTSLVKHANTTEAAQDELLICLGQTLKEKLQTHWKTKKSEEIVRQLFLNICFRIFMTQLQGYIQMALERQGCKNFLEEYLEEDERAKEAKKLKNQKKKQKQKLKKQEKKQEEQKKQQEEELRKKQEEELKKKLKQEARELKKLQEELLLKQKQLEEVQKRDKLLQQQQSKSKKKKGKKEVEIKQQQEQEDEEESQQNENSESHNSKLIYAEASPIKQLIKGNESMNNSNIKTQATTADCLQINQQFDSSAAANDDSDSQNDNSFQSSQKKSNSLEQQSKNTPNQNSKTLKSEQQAKKSLEQTIVSPRSKRAAAAAGVFNNQTFNNSANKNSLASAQVCSNKSNAGHSNIGNASSCSDHKNINEREISLLKSMGWKEEQEIIIEIPQTDINHYSQNKKKFDKELAFYRKTLHERFLSIINKQKSCI